MYKRLAPIVVLGALLSGCGSTGRATTTESPAQRSNAPTKAQFIAQAEAICRSEFAKVSRIDARLKPLEGKPLAVQQEAIGPIFEQAAEVERVAITELESLRRPQSGRGVIAKWLTATSERVTDYLNYAHAFAANEYGAVEADKATMQRVRAREEGLSEGYGIKCGKRNE